MPSFAPPHRPLCAAPTRPARYVSGFWTQYVTVKLQMQCHKPVDSQNKDRQRAVKVRALSSWQAGKGRTRFQRYFLQERKLAGMSDTKLKTTAGTKKGLKRSPSTVYFEEKKFIPGHALHMKGLQRQIGVCTLVSSQEQRARLVPVTNRLSTAGQPGVLFFHRFTKDFSCSCFQRHTKEFIPLSSGG